MTQVIVRSSANINSGGKTRVAAFTHGGLLLAAALIFPRLMNQIPLACLAAVLLVVGYKLASIKLFRSMWAKGLTQFLPFIATIVAIVMTDLLTGIAIGMALAGFFILYRNYQLPFHMRKHTHEDGRPEVEIIFSEEVSFLNRGRIIHAFQEMQDGTRVILDMRRVVTIDPDVEDAIEDFLTHAPTVDVTVEIHRAETGAFPAPSAPSAPDRLRPAAA